MADRRGKDRSWHEAEDENGATRVPKWK